MQRVCGNEILAQVDLEQDVYGSVTNPPKDSAGMQKAIAWACALLGPFDQRNAPVKPRLRCVRYVQQLRYFLRHDSFQFPCCGCFNFPPSGCWHNFNLSAGVERTPDHAHQLRGQQYSNPIAAFIRRNRSTWQTCDLCIKVKR